MFVNVADGMENLKMRPDLIPFLPWLKTPNDINVGLIHSLQLFPCLFIIELIFVKAYRESSPVAWQLSVVDDELPHKMVQGGPEVIGNLTYSDWVVSGQFRYVSANNRRYILLCFKDM